MNTARPQRKFPRLDLSWIDAELPKVLGFSQMACAVPSLAEDRFPTQQVRQPRRPRKAHVRYVDVALHEAEERLCAAVFDNDRPSASLISPFVADIARLRLEKQEMADWVPTRWQRAFPCAFR